jgi:hypothetical protein
MRSIIGALLVMGAAASAIAEEPTPSGVPPCVDNCAAPVDARFVIENDYVQVLRLSIPAHARTPMHDVTARVVVWLSDAHFVDRYADGKVIDETRKAGDAEWVPARRHSGENLSDRPMEFIAVVLKGDACGERPSPHARDRQ